MKNIIWIGKNGYDDSYICTQKIVADKQTSCLVYAESGGSFGANASDACRYSIDIYNLNLKLREIVEIIIDTETQKYEVKRPREIGWYLVECKSVEDDGLIFACHWDGENWNPIRNKNKWRKGTIWKGLDENEVTVHSEKLPYNEYLKSLE